ncbi:MAG: [FeFe] hydrogenase, group A [Planctomycetes bacterium]|jgi:iron-only hydrogenase group A|nr:[FeFe] hydrogenase, group A [Planctomycetota bacterium]
MSKVSITINGKKISCSPEQTILDIAKENGIFIPSLCYHPDFCAKGTCRVCVVEVSGKAPLFPACVMRPVEGMEVFTDSKKVKEARDTTIDLLYSQHAKECPDCCQGNSCDLNDLAKRYGLKKNFIHRKKNRKTYKFANAVEIDGSKCIDCRNCIDACAKIQEIKYLELDRNGSEQEVIPTTDPEIDCIYCGQCAVHCPVNAAREQSQWKEVEKILKQKNRKKTLVIQFAPSIRVSIGEEFGLPYGEVVTGKITTALKKLGFDYVFDVNFGADITTVVEAKELVERLNNKKAVFPMMTACCPAWVKYVEFYHPELIPNLTTSRSPQIHNGGVIKSYWAKQKNINPKDIVVVSIMPCTAKKFEASREELFIDGISPVDYVITNREFAKILRSNKIDFAKLESQENDDVMTSYSGAAAIYGSSGGVMESALRTAHFLVCGDNKSGVCSERIEFTEVRGLTGVKEAIINVGGKELRIAVANEIRNAKKVIDNLASYDYVEIMACPGGCIGGGGQSIPTTPEIRKKRMEALYKIDKGKKIRKAHDNKGVMDSLEWLENNKIDHKILHTTYVKRNKNK